MSNIKMMPLHTFELSLIITVEEYQNCRNILYATAKEIDAQCFDESIRTVLFKGIFVTVRHSMTFH